MSFHESLIVFVSANSLKTATANGRWRLGFLKRMPGETKNMGEKMQWVCFTSLRGGTIIQAWRRETIGFLIKFFWHAGHVLQLGNLHPQFTKLEKRNMRHSHFQDLMWPVEPILWNIAWACTRTHWTRRRKIATYSRCHFHFNYISSNSTHLYVSHEQGRWVHKFL